VAAVGLKPVVFVRQGRGHVELRVDGTLASAHDVRDGRSGLVWQAIAAPLLALRPERRRRVLILGMGGGSVARVVRAIAPDAEIVGVEHNADVVAAARAHLGLDSLEIEVVVEDALAYLRGERRSFDAVIEDVFVGPNRTVRKPDWLPVPGLELAARRVARGGVLVSNTIHETSDVARHLEAHHPLVVEIGVAGYWNRILAAGPATLGARRLRSAMAREPVVASNLDDLHLRTRKSR